MVRRDARKRHRTCPQYRALDFAKLLASGRRLCREALLERRYRRARDHGFPARDYRSEGQARKRIRITSRSDRAFCSAQENGQASGCRSRLKLLSVLLRQLRRAFFQDVGAFGEAHVSWKAAEIRFIFLLVVNKGFD